MLMSSVPAFVLSFFWAVACTKKERTNYIPPLIRGPWRTRAILTPHTPGGERGGLTGPCSVIPSRAVAETSVVCLYKQQIIEQRVIGRNVFLKKKAGRKKKNGGEVKECVICAYSVVLFLITLGALLRVIKSHPGRTKFWPFFS